jgi:hypothetical protein
MEVGVLDDVFGGRTEIHEASSGLLGKVLLGLNRRISHLFYYLDVYVGRHLANYLGKLHNGKKNLMQIKTQLQTERRLDLCTRI